MQTNQSTPGTFLFGLSDLKSWTIQRVDGTVTKCILLPMTQVPAVSSKITKEIQPWLAQRILPSYTPFCDHRPEDVPLAVFQRKDGPLRLWVASMGGARATASRFDFVIDAGDVINQAQFFGQEILDGDKELVNALLPYTNVVQPTARLLKIDWEDRGAPNVLAQFWIELSSIISGDVMTCCIGGHGRSGTTFVCLLLNNAPDYDALDAIIHLRAVHCPRAIESVVQHEYINSIAKYLGRAENAKVASSIPDYKAAFMASKKPTAIATQKMLGWDKLRGRCK